MAHYSLASGVVGRSAVPDSAGYYYRSLRAGAEELVGYNRFFRARAGELVGYSCLFRVQMDARGISKRELAPRLAAEHSRLWSVDREPT